MSCTSVHSVCVPDLGPGRCALAAPSKVKLDHRLLFVVGRLCSQFGCAWQCECQCDSVLLFDLDIDTLQEATAAAARS